MTYFYFNYVVDTFCIFNGIVTLAPLSLPITVIVVVNVVNVVPNKVLIVVPVRLNDVPT
jgi:hypothetical protein